MTTHQPESMQFSKLKITQFGSLAFCNCHLIQHNLDKGEISSATSLYTLDLKVNSTTRQDYVYIAGMTGHGVGYKQMGMEDLHLVHLVPMVPEDIMYSILKIYNNLNWLTDSSVGHSVGKQHLSQLDNKTPGWNCTFK